MKTFQNDIRSKVRWWEVICLYILQIAVFQFMKHVTFPVIQKNLGSLKIFDMMKHGYDISKAHEIIDKMGTEGMRMYLHVQMPFDFIYPVIMATVYCLVLVKTSTRFRYSYFVFPALLILFDWMENVCIIRMLTSEAFTERLVRFSSFCTCTKVVIGDYILYFAVIIGIIFHIVRWLISKFAKEGKHDHFRVQ